MTHMKYVGIFLLILVIALALVAHRYRIFAKFTVREIDIPGGTLVFSVYQGSYKRILPFVEKVKNEIAAQVLPEGEAKAFVIYYDDPRVEDSSRCRALVGIVLEQERALAPRFDVKDFARKSRSYHAVDFQGLSTFGATFPLHTAINIACAVRWGYPAVRKYGAQKGLMESARCAMEIYDRGAKEMTICFPYGPSADFILYLSGLPAPPRTETRKHE